MRPKVSVQQQELNHNNNMLNSLTGRPGKPGDSGPPGEPGSSVIGKLPALCMQLL